MTEEQRPIPDVEDVESALSAIMEPCFAEPAWATDSDVTSAAAVLTLELIGGPSKPRTPGERRERLKKLRALLEKLASSLRKLEAQKIEARIRLDFESDDDHEEAYAQEASRLANAATTIFQLDPEGERPKALRKHTLYAQAQKRWEDAFEKSLHKRWFERERLKPFLLPTLAEWIIEYEKAHRRRSRTAEGSKGGGEEPRGESNGPTGASNKEAETEREPPAPTRSPVRFDVDAGLLGSRAALIGWATAGAAVLLLIVLGAIFGLSSVQQQPLSSPGPSPSPAPPPSKSFGGGAQSKLFQPECGVLAASGADPGEKNRRLAAVDMDFAARRIRQPPEAYPNLRFGRVVKIRPFEVVQVSAIVQNAGPGPVARGVRLRLSFPTRPSTRTSIAASAEAANTRPDNRFRTSGVVALVSLDGRPFRLGNFRAVTVQGNERKQTLYWGRFERFPDCALESKRTNDGFEVVTPPPSIDGALGAGLDDAYRLSMLADVIPGNG